MKSKKTEKIFNEQLQLIKPSEEMLRKINKTSDEFCRKINDNLIKNEIKADVFLGGSVAKGTLVHKNIYDIDVFVRFQGNKDEEISDILGKILDKKFKKVHGSRDYFQNEIENILIEVIPVLKIEKPGEAENVTDLSYFHVKYVLEKIKNDEKLKNEIILAKNFCYAQNVYGAESYIKGFSGYALELLICHYKTLLNLMQEISQLKDNEKLIIDDAHFYSSKEELLKNLNFAKRQSPIILIDPTFKERNALSSLSKETFLRFKKACKDFLNKPSRSFFVQKNISDEFKKFKQVKIISVKTNKQVGDIAGTKSKKFYEFFLRQLKKEFRVKKNDFEYNEESNKANFYFLLDKRNDEIVKGPALENKMNVEKFKKVHSNAFIKGDFVYAAIKHNVKFDEWFSNFKKKYKKIIKEMGITYLRKK
ncbi:nucleotidyltransferase domain-containing protein [Candidatus Pacearchaeota archaeon]|nr:nucleotidyltransferase domain-containing protein [Candidatus Pacearchaeota archaeon]